MGAATLGLPKPYQFAYYVASLQAESARYSEESRKETPNFWLSHMPYLTTADMKTFHFKFATTNVRQAVYRERIRSFQRHAARGSIHLGWKSQGSSSSSDPAHYLLDVGTDAQDFTDFSSFFKHLSLTHDFPGEPFQPFTSRIDDRYETASSLLDIMADIRQLFEEIPNECSHTLNTTTLAQRLFEETPGYSLADVRQLFEETPRANIASVQRLFEEIPDNCLADARRLFEEIPDDSLAEVDRSFKEMPGATIVDVRQLFEETPSDRSETMSTTMRDSPADDQRLFEETPQDRPNSSGLDSLAEVRRWIRENQMSTKSLFMPSPTNPSLWQYLMFFARSKAYCETII
jgi:hypothetical protein